MADAFYELAVRFRAESGIEATSTVNGDVRSLVPKIDAVLLRVAQEALANVEKHAKATRVTLTRTYLDDSACSTCASVGLQRNRAGLAPPGPPKHRQLPAITAAELGAEQVTGIPKHAIKQTVRFSRVGKFRRFRGWCRG